MNPKHAFITICGLVLASNAYGQFEMTRYVIAGGGGDSAAGVWQLSGTIGQADAGATMSGGSWQLTGGLWANVAEPDVPCAGDADGDDTVNITDLGIVLSQFGMSGAELEGDLNDDGFVNITDLGIVLGQFGTNCP